MALRGNIRKYQQQIKRGTGDERISKLIGLFCILTAVYLFIAFTSYIFTWAEDQSIVKQFDWGLLTERGQKVRNSLGHLGAIVSFKLFEQGIGLSAFILIFLSAITGFNLILKKGINQLFPFYKYSFILVMWLAVFFEFVAGQDAEFPWGGVLGAYIAEGLTSFIGNIGTFILLFFSIIFGTILYLNPDFNEWTWERGKYETKFFLRDIMPKRFYPFIDKIATTYLPPLPETVKSKAAVQKTTKKTTPKTLTPNRELPKLPTETNDEKEKESEMVQGQLDFDMEGVKKKPTKRESLKKGEGELEILNPDVIDGKTGKGKNLSEIDKKLVSPKLSVTAENATHIEPYDPTLDLASYKHPTLELLQTYNDQKVEIDRAELEANKDQIIETLLNYKIEIIKIKATIGPTVTLYEIIPAPGIRISKIKNLEDDIALSLAALGIRIIAPIPGRGTIGIEVPNKKPQIVSLRETLISDKFKMAKMDLPIALGKTISNEVLVADLAKMPHLLIAGATGQGKSVGINTILMSLLYKKHPSQLKLILIDPKKVELSPYSKIENHFLGVLPGEDEPIVTETDKVVGTLLSLTIEMDQRYDLLKKAHVRNIKEYNTKFVQRRLNPEKGHRFLPYIVLVIDEFADLIMVAGKEIELPIGRLAQLARAIGIHLIIATQRPSVNIITGVIKANFPARIAFKVASKIDSRTILDTGGAEQLIGRGDMLLSVGSNTVRLQCAFVDTPEVEKVIDFIHQQRGYPEPFFLPEFMTSDSDDSQGAVKFSELDENFEDAARLLVQDQRGSTSMIQRKLRLGYNRAGRIMDQMEALGIVGPNEGSKAREVLIYDLVELERFLEQLKNKR